MADVVVIGAGIVGLACGLALARRGLRACLVERATPGAEASGAAAGILGAQAEVDCDGPLARVFLAGRERALPWMAELAERTGIDIELRRCGVLVAASSADELARHASAVAWQEQAGLRVEHLDAAEARAAEPALAEGVTGALRFPDDARVDPPKLVAAAHAAAKAAGVDLRLGAAAARILTEAGAARAVELETGERIAAARVVLAAGSWSSLVEGSPLEPGAVRPVRGQVVELAAEPGLVRGVVYGPDCYLSPRDDGRVLIGSTAEDVGFRRGVTAEAVARLIAAAIRLIPPLAGADVKRAWSGLRPRAADGWPLLGTTPIEGLVVATGHFRNGILLAALTGDVVADLITGAEPAIDLRPFTPSRALAIAPERRST